MAYVCNLTVNFIKKKHIIFFFNKGEYSQYMYGSKIMVAPIV